MDNRSKSKKNRRTVTVTLKDGKTATLKAFEEVEIRGNVAFSHFLTPISRKAIEMKNEKRSKWAEQNRDKTYYLEDVNNPYAEISLTSVSIVNNGSYTDADRFVEDRFYESRNAPGVKRANFKNYVSTVSTAMIDDSGNVASYTFDDEIALDSEVICKGQIYITKNGNPAIALTEVISIGEPQYLDRSKYQKSKAA